MADNHSTAEVSIVVVDEGDDQFDLGTHQAIAGFLAGYSGTTLISYTADLRLFAAWCTNIDLQLFEVNRAHIEIFGREMESSGRMRSTVARRMSTISGSFKYCLDEEFIERNPATNVRRPKVDYESRTLGLSSVRCSSKPVSVHHEITHSWHSSL